ncbi:hypothetical protein D3C86_1365790 [compost metagenome]
MLIAFQQGRTGAIDIARMMTKRLSIAGATLRARSAEVKEEIAAVLGARIWPLMDAGRVRPVIDTVYSVEQAALAHERLASGAAAGKLLLRMRRE